MEVQKSSGVAEVKGVDKVGRKDVLLANRFILISSTIILRILRQGSKGLGQVRVIEQVAREDRISIRESPIVTGDKVIFGSRLQSGTAYECRSGGCVGVLVRNFSHWK